MKNKFNKFFQNIKNKKLDIRQNLFLTLVLLFGSGIVLGLGCLFWATVYLDLPMFFSYFQLWLLPFLNILPVILLLFFFYILLNRAWLSFLITSIICVGITWINYSKVLIRTDPLLAIDMTLFFESLNMAGQYELQFGKKVFSIFFICILGTIFLKYIANGKISNHIARAVSLLSISLIGIIAFFTLYMNQPLYDSIKNNELINPWSETEVYISKGVLYPFIYSIKSIQNTPPEGYDENKAKSLLAEYNYKNIPENKKINIISIMLEAYNDFSKFEEIKFKEDVYKIWHSLEDESYSGEIVTNVFGAETIQTERAFLTSFTSLRNFRAPLYSHVRYFKEQGYTVEGSHPSYNWFYNRKNVNKYLGFDDYYYLENHFTNITNGQIAPDHILFPEIIDFYEKNKSTGKPYFGFHVTYQNHGPYASTPYTETSYIEQNKLPDNKYHMLNNYLSGIANTNFELENLINYFRKEQEPVILILFGDHNPALGVNNSVYHSLDINIDISTTEGFYNYYNTPYIIWGNEKAKKVLENDLVGDAPLIGPYFLMNELFTLIDFEGNEFLQRGTDLKKALPVIHRNGMFKELNQLTSKPSKHALKKYQQYLYVQYFLKNTLPLESTNY